MSSLTTVEYLNIASIAYADFEQSDVGSTLDDLIRDGSISSSLLQDPARAAFADPDFPLRDWELVGVKDGGLNGFFAIALKDPTTGEIVFSFRGSQDVADWTLSNFQITTSLLTPAQFAVAEQFVFETLNTAGPVCYNTLSDMYDAVGSSSNVSFTGHSLGGGLAQYMTYKTADFNDTDSGAASVTFNAVGIGQALDDLSLLASAPYYNSVDHVNSNDVVGGYGMQLGQTIRHIDDSEIDYSRVDFAILSEMIFVQIKAAEGTLDAVQASKQLSDLKLALNLKSPESYLHTMSVFVGYSGVGGDGVSFSSYHGLDNFLMDNPNGDGQVMTATVTSQSDYLKLGAIFQLVNALQVINISKSEGNYTTNVSTLPPALQVTSSGGVDYYSPYSHGLENYNYTYSQAAIAYANSIVQNASRNLKASSLAQPYVEYQQAIASNVQRIDPLILDLDNDGIETIHINNSNAFFDLDLNGFAENTSWADSDDGFLVLDRNQDGIINNASELFGDRTLLDDGVTYASSGFQALAEYDENADGVIDTIDSIYSLLRVWQDANGDGVSAASELKSLLDLGIVSIALSYLNTGITDSADNIQVRVGEFTLADGSTSAIGEYLFNRDTANSIEEPLVNVPPEIAVLPNIQGAGNVSSLYKAMLDDTSGDLQNLVEDFLAEDDAMARNALIEQIIIKWTGSDSIDPTSRGGLFDAQKLAAMEKFYGLNFNGNPTANSVNLLTSSYNKLVENMYVSFIAETHLKDILGLVDVDFSGNLIFTDVRDEVDSLLATNEATGLSTLSELTRVVKHYGLGDTDGFMALRNYYAVQSDVYAKAIDFAGTKPLVGTSSDDYLSTSGNQTALDGGEGSDYLYANTTSSVALYGGAGNDNLYGSVGSDILNGGTGNDRLEGGTSNDTYMFGHGFGVDTIADRDATEGNIDTIRFLDDVASEDVIARRNGNNLELSILGTEDKLIVEQYFSRYYSSGWYSYDIGENGNKVEQIIFADGTTWGIVDIKEMARNITGTAGSDSLGGYDDQNDIVLALDGDDYVTTNAGNDVIDGGTGNDTIYAGIGNDALTGGAGNDSLYANDGNDILDGGAGNDELWGEAGNDTYIFGRGYGADIIRDRDATEGNTDTISMLEGVSPDDVTVVRSGNNLVLKINDTEDTLTVEQYFSRYYSSGWYSYDIGEDGNKIEVVEFADGTTWDMATVLNKARFINGTDQAETIYGYETNEVIAAGAGDDVVYASSGDDVVNAGDGSDIVYGDYGNDTLQGEAGNDTVYGGEGSDILDGGTGNDLLEGGTGNDTYIFGIGYGVDTIYDSDGSENNQDTIQFLEGIDPQDVVVARSGSNLELSISGTTDKLIIEHYFNSYTRNGYYTGSADGNKIEQIKFTDGTTWSIADVKDKARYINGTSNGEQLSGFGDQQNIIAAGDGNDTVYAGGLGDQIDGGAGNDSLFGSSGSDTLTGGAGNDQLEGHYGNDRYVFASGFGNDTIYDLDSTEGNVDTIQFLEGIDPADVVARRSGDDLVLGVTGTSDSLTIDQYFSQYTRNGYNAGGSDAQKVEVIEFANGTVWSISDIKDKVRYITGTDNNDYLSGFSDQQDFIFAGAGDDTLYASGDNGDELRGEAGNDTLYGSYGSDTLNGGTGNDALEGSAGNDVYLFGLGYGTDTIYDNDTTVGNQDTIQFLLGITPEDIVVKRSGDNLELSIVNTTDKLIVQNYFSGYYRNSGYYAGENANKIEAVVFADGTSWDTATVSDKARHIAGTEDGDVISGFSTDDVIMALAGDDAVYASSGNDIVHGGDGNDQVYGDSGNDQLFGNVGNDTLYGADGQDALDGGAGTDLLEGSYGNDTYVFGIGYGQDTIYDNDTTESNLDIVSFLPGISPADVAVRRNGDNLELRITGTEDVLVVERYFSPYARNSWYTYNTDMNKVEEFHFDNGTIWDVATIADKARYIDGTDQADTLSGFSTDDVITAGAGDDTVYASSGSDTVNAGDGNDILYGDSGNDILRGNAGNDSIYGSDGNDTLDGSTGTDLLEGSYGNDTYIFGLGYGTDIIYDNDTTQGNVDAINLQAGISPEDVLVKRNGDNLELHITGTADTLIVERYFSPYARNSWYTYDVNMNKIEQIVFDDGTIWDIATIADKARYMAGTEDSDTISGFDTNDVIRAGAGDDTVYASSGDDIVHGNGGNDMLYGDSGSDQLFGDAGNDTLHGADGNDVFDGGAGNDLLEGSYGNDTYVFGIGSGVDTIYDNDTTQANMDIVNFLPGIDPANVNVRRNGDNLELGIAGTEDTLIIERYFSPYARNSWYTYNVNMNKVEEFHFDNGTIWDVSTILDKARFITGTSGNDSLYGYGDQENIINAGEGTDTIYAAHLGDELYGEAGNDSLYGSSGTDILDGGIGNDILEGSAGNDTYIFSLGFGVDTIYDNDTTQSNVDVINFQAGIAAEDVLVKRNGDNLELRVAGTTDMLIVERYFSPYARGSWYTYNYSMNKIEQIVFNDGTVWDIATVLEKARIIDGTEASETISGFSDQQNIITAGTGDDIIYAGSQGDQIDAGDGNDTVYGSSGSDRITGGIGNDILEGSTGNDTYVFAPGFGVDTIYDNDNGQGNSFDIVEFAANIAAEDVVVRRLSNGDLELTVLGTSDKLTIERYFSNYYRNSSWNTGTNSNAIEEFRFADGTVWDIADIKDKARFIEGTTGDDSISGFGDQQNIINAGDGNDTIYAGSSLNDELYGEGGNDTLMGTWNGEKFDGGVGNDYMEGSAGNDTYVFGLGYGQDVIYDSTQGQSAGLDKVTFLEGIDPANVGVKRLSNSDLEITFAGTSDKLTIERYFSNYYKNSSWNTGTDSNVVEELHFADGTIWTAAIIKEKVRTMNGTGNNDTLQGFSDQQNLIYAGTGDDVLYAGGMSGDKLYGEADNDIFYGSWASETLDGGTGNDLMEGNAGDDTYVFGLGYGQDTIYDSNQGQGSGLDKVTFLAGINPADVTAKRLQNSDLELTFAESSDKLTIERFFSNYYKNSTWNTGANSNVIEEFHFADNTVWDLDDIKTMVRTVNGTENNDALYGYEDADTITAGSGDDSVYASQGDDTISGNAGNDSLYGEDGSDILDGGTGNDTLHGGYGNDTYVFSGAFGNDQVNDYHGNDLVQFGDLGKDSLIFEQVGNALRIIPGGSSDSISIDYWYSYNDYKIETIKDANGNTINSSQVEQLIQAMASWSNDNNGMSWSQALSSNSQDVQNIMAQYWTAPTV